MRKKRTTIIALACGVVCAACVFLYLQGMRGQMDENRREMLARYGGEQVEVCVASCDIAAGEQIVPSSIEKKQWVAALLPEQAVCDIQDVVGKQVSSPILKGEVISQKRFALRESIVEVPEGLSAISVSAKEVQAVGGAISPGMYVDIYATGDSATTLLGSNVLVLATSVSTYEEGDGTKSSGGTMAWVALAVDPAAVQELVAAEQRSELYFVLPGAQPKEKSDSEGNAAGTTMGVQTTDALSGGSAREVEEEIR